MDYLSSAMRQYKSSQIILSCALILFLLAIGSLIFHFALNEGYLIACGKAGCSQIYHSSQTVFFWVLLITYATGVIVMLFGTFLMLRHAIRFNPEERLSGPKKQEPSNKSSQPTR